MNPRLALLLAALCIPCWAQAAAAAPPSPAEPAQVGAIGSVPDGANRAAQAAAASPAQAEADKTAPVAAGPAAPSEPAVQHIVVQGRDTRIDELRVRGQTRRIVVTGAGGTRYEVIPADGLRELPDAAGTTQGAAGKRVWRVLNF